MLKETNLNYQPGTPEYFMQLTGETDPRNVEPLVKSWRGQQTQLKIEVTEQGVVNEYIERPM